MRSSGAAAPDGPAAAAAADRPITADVPRLSPHYWSLDVLRGTLALTVFLTHWILGANLPPTGALETAIADALRVGLETFTILFWPTGAMHPAVVGFFVLSGFCVHGPFERRLRAGAGRGDWRPYFLRRARRIFPVYWAGALLGLLAVAVQAWRPVADPALALQTLVTPGRVFARLTASGGLWLEEILAGNPPLSTVDVEVLLYLVYPLFFLGAAAGRWRLLGAVALGMHVSILFLWPYMNPFVLQGGILAMALFWYMGALAAHLWYARNFRMRGLGVLLVWLLFLGTKALPAFFGRNLLKQCLWAGVCTLLILWLVGREDKMLAWRDWPVIRVLRWVGQVSYSLFAVHLPIILLTTWTLLTFAPAAGYLWQLVISGVACAAMTVAVYYGIERRFLPARG